MLKKFPFYKQHDMMDCGPSCLRMIAKHYGKVISLAALRHHAFLTKEGASMSGISAAAETIGFSTMAVRIPFDKLLTECPLPAIVHWNKNHFVVVYKAKGRTMYVADPAIGLLTYREDDFKKRWISSIVENTNVGVALLLEPGKNFAVDGNEPTPSDDSLFQLLGYLKNYKKYFFQLFLGLLLGSCVQLILPFLTQSVVDVGINTRNVSFIYIIMAAQLMLFFSRTAVDFIRRWILLHLSTRINIAIISDFLIKLMKLPLSFFDSKMIGDLLQRVEDHSRIERFLSSSSLNILFSFFNLIIFGVVLALYNSAIFFVFFLLSSVYVLYVVMFLKRRKALDYKRFTQLSGNQNTLIQLIHGMPEIKLNNCERQKRWEWQRIQARIFRLNIDSMKLLQYQDAGSLFINELKNIIITFMASLAVINGEMTLGMMLAVQYIIGQLNSPINEFLSFTREYQDAKISLERINEVHGFENEEPDVDLYEHTDVHHGSTIVLENVSFSYHESTRTKILEDVNLVIPEGKVTAIVGASGSGKTTLLKLLLKFYNVSSGNITVGNTNLKVYSSSAWRRQCGVVMQDGYIFSDSIARNIALAGEAIDKQRLLHAVRVANIHEFIDGLPLGFNTKLGASGIGLSQGQKQRMLIARAVYKNPDFIFFDEATSSLDTNNEMVIMKNLQQLFKGKTVVVIAHRLSTVKNADQIVVLNKGRIVESGTHSELSMRSGAYYDLIRNQLELEQNYK